jgi:hypothetical protein
MHEPPPIRLTIGKLMGLVAICAGLFGCPGLVGPVVLAAVAVWISVRYPRVRPYVYFGLFVGAIGCVIGLMTPALQSARGG